MTKIKLEYIDNLRRGKKSGAKIGSRGVPHHLFSVESGEMKNMKLTIKNMYKTTKNSSRLQHATYLLLTVVFMTFFAQVQAHESTNAYTKLNQQSKITLEKRLGKFLNTVDRYELPLQSKLYKNLQDKIDEYKLRYEFNSQIYTMLEIIDIIAHHKIDSKIILSNNQILSHVIYGKTAAHYGTIPETEVLEEILQTQQESEKIYREDLFTNDLNEVDKNILSGSAKGIMQLEVRSNYEGVISQGVEFRFNENIDNIGLVGRLYQNGVFVGESSQSDVRGTVLTIDNLSNFIIGTQTSYVQLEIVTQAIGKEQVGKVLNNLRVISTTFKDNTGVITGDKIGDTVDTENSKNFSIVPADLEANVESELERYVSTAKIRITPNVGNNNNQGNVFSTTLSSINLEVSSFIAPGNITIYNSNGTEIGSANITSAGKISIPVNNDIISNSGETYRISITARGVFKISQNGIGYIAGNKNFESRFTGQLFLGQR